MKKMHFRRLLTIVATVFWSTIFLCSSNQAQTLAQWRGEHYPETRTRMMTEAEVKSWSPAKLRYAINEIYARHGLYFRDDTIRHQFQRFDWYHANPSISTPQIEEQFTDIEQANSRVLGQVRDASYQTQTVPPGAKEITSIQTPARQIESRVAADGPAAAVGSASAQGIYSKAGFQKAVSANDMPNVRHYFRPEYVDEPFRQHPEDPRSEPFPPVVHAACHGNTELLAFLAEHGANMKYEYKGVTLGLIAHATGHPDTEAVAVRCGSESGGATIQRHKITSFATGLGIGAAVIGAMSSRNGSSSSNPDGDLYHDRNGRTLSPVEVSGRITDGMAGLGDPYR